MTEKQRDIIIQLTIKNYEMLGCVFPFSDEREIIEYLYDSKHGDEIRCIESAITAHNIYNKDDMTLDDFFEWHGL